jgi:uncharacterized damage-inducible protein DinB
MNLSEPIVAELQNEAMTTRKMLARVPQDTLAWKPHEKSMTMGRLAGHIAEIAGIFTTIVTQDELDFAARDYNPFVPVNVSDLLELFDKNVAVAVELLKTQADERLREPWRLRNGGQIFFEIPRMAAIRTMSNHLIHHRGQLSVYLRSLNVPLPPIYGPTADEAASFQER